MMKSNINFKTICKNISEITILIFGVIYISSFFVDLGYWNSSKLRNIFIVIYLISSLYYYKAELKDRKIEIDKLKSKLRDKFD